MKVRVKFYTENVVYVPKLPLIYYAHVGNNYGNSCVM